jgi:hypothetical protein
MSRALALIVVIAAGTAQAMPYRFGLDPNQCSNGRCYVTAYFDNDRSTGVVRDWACGTKTYDNHGGTDYGIGGFTAMDAGRDVFAAQDGTVIAAHDGEFDRCTSGSCGVANYVWIKHADGQVSLYYHLKKNSVAVSVGQKVTCGQKLGQVGSSGYSTGPHFHFQVNATTDSNTFDDPYAGTTAACGGPFSWWIAQGAYAALPGFACPAPPAPDLVVSSVSASPAAPSEGDAVRFSATVKNQGAAASAAGLRVGFSVDGTLRGWAMLPALAAGATTSVTVVDGTDGVVWAATAGPHVVTATADDLKAQPEDSETNNAQNLSLRVTSAAVLETTPQRGEAAPIPAPSTAAPPPLGSGPSTGATDAPSSVVGSCGCTSSSPALTLYLLTTLLALGRRQRRD